MKNGTHFSLIAFATAMAAYNGIALVNHDLVYAKPARTFSDGSRVISGLETNLTMQVRANGWMSLPRYVKAAPADSLDALAREAAEAGDRQAALAKV